jgi:hypothetical protein
VNIKALIKTWRAATNIVEWMGGAIFNGDVTVTGALSSTGGVTNGAREVGPLTTVAYSAAPIIDASLGNFFVMTITNGTALVVGAPTNPPSAAGTVGQLIWFTVKNASGGAHGALTWNAVFKTQATAFSAVATGFSRTVAFRWDGTNWVEVVRTAADVAN